MGRFLTLLALRRQFSVKNTRILHRLFYEQDCGHGNTLWQTSPVDDDRFLGGAIVALST
jgi:hypothetical protein